MFMMLQYIYVHVLFFQLVLCTSTTFIPMGKKLFCLHLSKNMVCISSTKVLFMALMQRNGYMLQNYPTTCFTLCIFHENIVISIFYFLDWTSNWNYSNSRRMSVNKLNLGIISTFSCQIVSKFDSPFSRKFSFPSTE